MSQRDGPAVEPDQTSRAPLAGRQGAQAQGIQADEACRILLVIGTTVIFEGHEVVLVERLRRLCGPLTMTLPL